jgi:hypothetical protein
MNRIDYLTGMKAGFALTSALKAYHGRDRLLVLGIPPGGVAIAVEVANALIDDSGVTIFRNLGVFFHREDTILQHEIAGRVVIVIPDTQIPHDYLLSKIHTLETLSPEEIVVMQPSSPTGERMRLAPA